MSGAIQRANEETVAELKAVLSRVGDAYAKPALKLLAGLVGVDGPLADIFISAIKNCVDAYMRHDSEEAEFRAQTAVGMAAHRHNHTSLYDHVTPQRLKALYQRLTRKAVDSRIEDVVRVVVAATLGGSDGDIATAADLHAAEWLEGLPDSRLMQVQSICSELFPNSAIDPLMTKPAPSGQVKARFEKLPTEQNVKEWASMSPEWQEIKVELFSKTQRIVYCHEAALLWGHEAPPNHDHFWSSNRQWLRLDWFPLPILQRAHNAFVRAEEAMKFELKMQEEAE